jgi:Helix-turn-helix domain
VNWERLARANTHPLRVSILEVLGIDGGRMLSPKDLSLELQAPLSTVNYHVTELRRSGIVKVVDEQQVRGAIEHFYRAVADSGKKNARGKGKRKTRRPRSTSF